MALHAALQKRFEQTVTVKAHAGYNSRGDMTFATSASTHKARWDGKQHLVKGPDGRDVMAQGTLYVGPTSTGGAPALTVNAELTLPDGKKARILAVDTVRDRSAVNHQAVHLG